MSLTLPKTCKISKGTTLKELANFFRLTEEQLKRYHNTHCPLDDLIGYDIPEHVRMIYVPPDDIESREKIFNPKGGNSVNYKSKNTLYNKGSFNKRYGIIQKTFINGEEKLKLHYEIEIKKNNNKVEIKRKSVYLNHQRPDLIVEQMADKIGNMMYPLELELNDDGTIKETSNQQAILDRWLRLKLELEDYYRGKEAELIFQNVGKNIRSRSKFLHKIKDSLFYGMYFFPLYETFTEDKKYIFQMYLPLEENSGKVPFEVTLSLNEEISKTNKFLIQAEGKSIAPRLYSIHIPKNENNNQPTTEGYFDFTYKFNSKDNSIFAIYGEMGLKSQKLDKKITFECYEQLK
ncbi:hypothetical protein [Chryseobacterium shigense]|uniref:LysM domain-containing protein n=1 Tax=Chryseobacterium shigense TaxID=297244 RepID=A0A841N0X2_9FLAO|nr:hypothetical protein [Chryseobacterium shigense]MBB6370067.1 hypothetical protein [Chryseobacterium shigense]